MFAHYSDDSGDNAGRNNYKSPENRWTKRGIALYVNVNNNNNNILLRDLDSFKFNVKAVVHAISIFLFEDCFIWK